ncbi:hypothetical protein FRC17_000146 [Serendipita sp. 399]|nr:hypothetical protein FRC17_000146 [Serendipita sp. 399]
MPSTSYQLPVELWQEILWQTLDHGLYLDGTLTLFEKLDLFAPPCKIYHRYSRQRKSLRSVCRLWYAIIETKNDIIFMDPTCEVEKDIRFSRRLEIVPGWEKCCRRWPCTPMPQYIERVTSRGVEECKPDAIVSHYSDEISGLQLINPGNIQALRLYEPVQGPIQQFLRKCVNLEAVWVPFHRKSSLAANGNIYPFHRSQSLSYLHIDSVTDGGETFILHLPSLTYLSVAVNYHHSSIPPFFIDAPNLTTLVFSAAGVYSSNRTILEPLINSCRKTLLNLVLLRQFDYASFGAIKHLLRTLSLSSLGLSIDSVTLASHKNLEGAPSLTSTPVPLILFGLDTCLELSRLVGSLLDLPSVFTTGQKRFSKLVVANTWVELREIWDASFRDVDHRRGLARRDIMTYYWSAFIRMNRDGILIQDQTGTGIWEGEAMILAERMKFCSVENMSSGSYQLPVELWRQILCRTLYDGILLHEDATIFEKMDLFNHSHILYDRYLLRRESLRLVCRLWNAIIKTENDILFVDPFYDNFQDLRFLQRVEFVNGLRRYHLGSSYQRSGQIATTEEAQPGGIPQNPNKVDTSRSLNRESLVNVRILRLYNSVRAPFELLHECVNLVALWMISYQISKLTTSDGLHPLQNLHNLSYLHIDSVTKSGKPCTLHLPALTYLSIDFILYARSPTLPFEIHVPSLTSLVLSGAIYGDHVAILKILVNSCKDTLINLFILYGTQDAAPGVPFDQVSRIPHLATLGFRVGGVMLLPEISFEAQPTSAFSPLFLVLFGLDDLNQDQLAAFKQKLLSEFATEQRFSKLVIAKTWPELQHAWNTFPRDAEGAQHNDMKETLASFWLVLEQLDREGVFVQDRSGTGLWEGAAAILGERIKAYSEIANEASNEGSLCQLPAAAVALSVQASSRSSKLDRTTGYIRSYKQRFKDFVTR